MREEGLPQRVMCGELVGGKWYARAQEKERMVHLKEDMSAVGMKFEGWQKAALLASRWFRREWEGAESHMREWYDAQRCKSGERHETAAAGERVKAGGRGAEGQGEPGEERGERHCQETEVWVSPSPSWN